MVYDYFSKWSFARAIPDQTAERIVQVMRDDVFTLVGPPCVSNQTRDRKLRVEYWVISAWLLGCRRATQRIITPIGDRLVECMNRSLLALLRTYFEEESECQKHLNYCFLFTEPPDMQAHAI